MKEVLACPVGIVCKEKKVKFGVDEAVKFFLDKSNHLTHGRVNNFNSFSKEHFPKDNKSVNKFLNAFFEELARNKVKQSFSEDKLIIQATNYAEELDKVINIVFERLFEWFSLYYPEAALRINSVTRFAKALSKGLGRNRLSKKLRVRLDSMGADLERGDLAILEKNILEYMTLIRAQEETKNYVEHLMMETAPNLSKVATPLLGAKLLRNAGGLKNLARMPSSTIQVMGAEKALFMHLKTKSKPPKHGIIIQHPLLFNAPRKHKGKIARTLAAKISIAAKTDYYSKDEKGVADDINKYLKERVRKILEEKK